jgi:hypothetical protein
MIIVALGFIFTGCGGTDNMISAMTGTWKSNKDSSSIKINLSGEQKTINISGNVVPVTVKKVDKGSYIVTVNAKLANGKTSEWSLMQVWDDNGSAFAIRFGHNGEKETLTRVKG